MILRIALVVLLGISAAEGQPNSHREEQYPFQLEPGDFRFITVMVRQTPEEVDCHFEVLNGTPTVHLELMPLNEFRRFDRGLDHGALASTPEGGKGDCRKIIDMRGEYRIVAINGKHAPPASVMLQVHTSVDPRDVARTLSPERRLTVILVSFAFFFVSVTWSARKLIQGMRPG